MKKYSVLVNLPLSEKHKSKLESSCPGCVFTYFDEHVHTKDLVAEADIILGNVSPELINQSKKLVLLQLNSAGADPYINPGILSEKTVLANATGAYGKAVAEHGLALTLMQLKNLQYYRDLQLRNAWSDCGPVKSISDSTVMIMGLGDIGLYYARLVKAFGSYVIGVKRTASDKPADVDELYTFESLMELLPRADIIFSVLPATDATYHIYTADCFKAMKDTAIFINCGRGTAVATDVLVEALSNGYIASAAIDVAETEPIPADSPLWGLRNLSITPHVAGNFHLQDIIERIIDISIHNINALINGEEIWNVVDFSTGYRSKPLKLDIYNSDNRKWLV